MREGRHGGNENNDMRRSGYTLSAALGGVLLYLSGMKHDELL